ncbi:hypothetical protein [Nocardioides mangrovicus]|uniref:hypothetical protein n=1 Tax=Nocardioides mangrovicus TaxID=2478913 RepID=UPI0011C3EA68|nr:hypothetical protein [Nocardioides mangrovicus]
MTVANDVVDAQGYKLALTRDGVQEIQGDLPRGADLLMWGGEPAFVVAVLEPAVAPGAVPEDVGLALHRAVDRLYDVTRSGEEVDHPALGEVSAEWVHGPALTELGLLVSVDLDGAGFSMAMLETMVRILTEELATADAHTYLFAAPLDLDRHTPLWEPRTTSERSE